MPGDDEKKKKKKSKKEKAEEPEPEPEPAPVEPEPVPQAEEPPADDIWPPPEDEYVPVASEEAPPAGEEAPPPAEGEVLEGAEEEGLEPPPPPKKKPKFFVHWNRRKARFYDYNFDFGENYYSSMVNYMNKKNLGSVEVPRRMAWAERGMVSSLARKNLPDNRTDSLLHEIRASIKSFEAAQKGYVNDSLKRSQMAF